MRAMGTRSVLVTDRLGGACPPWKSPAHSLADPVKAGTVLALGQVAVVEIGVYEGAVGGPGTTIATRAAGRSAWTARRLATTRPGAARPGVPAGPEVRLRA